MHKFVIKCLYHHMYLRLESYTETNREIRDDKEKVDDGEKDT